MDQQRAPASLVSYVELEGKKKKEAEEEVKSKAKPRTIWDKPDIVDVTSNSLSLRWKPSSVPQYAVQVGWVILTIIILLRSYSLCIDSASESS